MTAVDTSTSAFATHRSTRSLAVAEVALCAVSVTLVCGFLRLFDSAAFLPRLVGVVLVAHLGAALVRRAGLRVWFAVPLLAALGILAISWIYLRSSISFGLPTPSTIHEARELLADAFGPFARLVAPVPLQPGFEIALAATLWPIAVFGDAAAFSGEAPVQGLVPPTVLFVGSAIFARHHGDLAAATGFAAAVAVFLAAHRGWRTTRRSWVAGDATRGGRRLAATGAALGLVAVAIASLGVTAAEPSTAGWVDLRELGRAPRPIQVANPLVGVGNLLGARANDLLFTVEADAAHYWRLTSLEDYDSATQQWRTKRSYREVESGARLGDSRPGRGVKVERSRITVASLPGIWLPAPFRPTSVDANVELRFDDDSGSVIVGGRGSVPPITYEVRSEIPGPVERTDGATPSGKVASVYLTNPGEHPVVAALLDEVIAGTHSRLEALRALQDWFRTDFTYDVGVDYSRDADPTTAFLEARRGFCQQFASTFAVMSRMLGVPSRVAVGFTYGNPTGAERDGRQRFEVHGRQAHAWPEVYLDGAGWVAFEPTPGRGNPDTESATQVTAAQDDGDSTPGVPTTTTALAPIAPPATAAEPPTTTAAPQPKVSTPPIPTDDGPLGLTWLWVTLVAVGAMGLATLARLGWVRRRRAAVDGTATDRVRTAWHNSCEWLALVDVAPRKSETPAEFGARASRVVEGVELCALAEIETARCFGQDLIGPQQAADAERIAEAVGVAVASRTTRRAHLAHALGIARRN